MSAPFQDPTIGKYIILFPDGRPMADIYIEPDPDYWVEGDEIEEKYGPTDWAMDIHFFDSIEEARECITKSAIEGLTYHRIEGMQILQQKFSY